MKKILTFVLATAVVLMTAVGVLAETVPLPPLQGVITQVMEDGSFLMEDTVHGQVLVQADLDATLEGIDEPAVGQYVFVWYGGAMTKSIPPQVTADRIGCYIVEGVVLSADAEAGTALIDSEEAGQVLVRLPEGTALPAEGDYLTVYTNGAMTMSEPGQVDGLKVDVYVVARGTVDMIGDGYFLLEGDAGTIRVNIGEETQIPEYLEEGDAVSVYYSGVMTKSIPPQVFGIIVDLDTDE